jgi:hypothetical protein
MVSPLDRSMVAGSVTQLAASPGSLSIETARGFGARALRSFVEAGTLFSKGT